MVFLLVVAALVLFAMLFATRERLASVEKHVDGLREELRGLESDVGLLSRRVTQSEGRDPLVAPAPGPILPAAGAAPAPVMPPPLKPAPVMPPTVKPASGVAAEIEPRKQPAVAPVAAAAGVARVEPTEAVASVSADTPSAGGFDWESLIGVKFFSGVAAVAGILAAIFFLRIAVERGWLQPPLRVAIGIAVGISLLLFCERKAAGRYRITANALDAAAVTILYSTFYAAHALWQLIGGLATFGLLALVTVLAVTLAIRRSSVFIAALGLLGGFAAPALLSTGQDNAFGLFGYLVLLNAGLAWVARRKGWVQLLMAALALTTFYQWSWVFAFLTVDNVGVAVAVFVTFPVLAGLLLTAGGMATDANDPAEQARQKPFRLLAVLSAVLPYFAAFYLVGPPLGEQFLWLFGLLFLLDTGLLAVAIGLKHEELHALGGMCTVAVTLLWLVISYSSAAWPIVLVIVSVFVAFYLLAPFVASWLRRPFNDIASYAVYAAPVMLVSFSILAAREPATAAPGLLFGVLAALMLVVAFAALYLRRPGPHIFSIATAVLALLAWESVAWGEPWPTLAVVGAMTLPMFAAAWLWVAGRRGISGPSVRASVVVALVGAQIVTLGATLIPGAPALWVLATASVALLCGLLLTSWRTKWAWLAPTTLVLAFAAPAWWIISPHTGSNWSGGLLFGGLIYAVFICYPVTLGRRVGSLLPPYLAAAVANVPFFFIAYWALEQGGFDPYIGALPLAQATVMAGLLLLLLRVEAPAHRTLGRLAMVAGTGLAAVTLAIPLQVDHEWLTLGWALEGAALAWLFTRIPHRGLLWWSTGLMAAVFVRLAMNPFVFEYAPRGEMRILNWYLYTYLVCSIAFLAVGRLLWRSDDQLHEQLPVRVSRLGPSAAAILLFILVNIEIADFYSVGPSITFELGGATLAQNLTYTLAWGVFGVILLVVGIVARSHAARVAALVLLVVTVLKCFLFDLGRLTGLYRVGSFVGLAVCLALVAIILQKYVLVRPGSEKP